MIDGDAARAARREALGRNVTYRLDSRVWTFPVEMPLSLLDLEQVAEDEKWALRRFWREALALLLADQADDFFKIADLSVEDLEDCWRAVLRQYAVTPGESQSSPDSAATGGASSKRSSSGSTRSTRARSGGPAVSAA